VFFIDLNSDPYSLLLLSLFYHILSRKSR